MNSLRQALRLLALFAVVLLVLAAPQTRARAQYVIDIVLTPSHPAIFDSWFFGINKRGQTTGYVATRNHEGTFVENSILYRGGDFQVLTTGPRVGGGLVGDTTGLAINDRGDVVGVLQYGFLDPQPIFFPADGTQTPILTPGLETSAVLGLNDSRTVLTNGFSNSFTTVSERYGLWQPQGFRPLPVLDVLYPMLLPPDPTDFNSGPQSFAYDAGVTGLNNADQFAAGVRQFYFDPNDLNNPDGIDQFLYAYVFNGEHGYRLLQPASSGDEIIPIGIDNKGWIFGWMGERLALWGRDGSLEQVYPALGPNVAKLGPGGFPTAQRNERGQVVAITSDGGIVRYRPKSGVWTNITSSIRGLDASRFDTIQGFNPRGQFVGTVTPPKGGGWFGFVVSPDADDED